jgi:hypothetical protein
VNENLFKWFREAVWRGTDSGSDLTNKQCKPIWNCNNDSPMYNEYTLIKMLKS